MYAGQVRQHSANAPVIVNLTELVEALVVVSARRFGIVRDAATSPSPLRAEATPRRSPRALAAAATCSSRRRASVEVAAELGGVSHVAVGEIDRRGVAELGPQRDILAEQPDRLRVLALPLRLEAPR